MVVTPTSAGPRVINRKTQTSGFVENLFHLPSYPPSYFEILSFADSSWSFKLIGEYSKIIQSTRKGAINRSVSLSDLRTTPQKKDLRFAPKSTWSQQRSYGSRRSVALRFTRRLRTWRPSSGARHPGCAAALTGAAIAGQRFNVNRDRPQPRPLASRKRRRRAEPRISAVRAIATTRCSALCGANRWSCTQRRTNAAKASPSAWKATRILVSSVVTL